VKLRAFIDSLFAQIVAQRNVFTHIDLSSVAAIREWGTANVAKPVRHF
jgi:hypothetical protein